jgi:membrane-associated protease RseP (regulator of RpoE activity)
MVAVAGSTMHFLQTLVCLFLLFTVTGSPGGHLFAQDHDYWRIDQVVDGSPAQQAGLQAHDRVTAVNGISIKTSEDFRGVIAAHPGEPLALDVERDGNHITLTATPEMNEGVSRIGVQISDLPEREKVGVLTATGRIFTDFGAGVRESISELGRFFSPSGLSDFASQVRHGGTPTVDTSNGTAPASGSPSADGNRPISIIGAAGIGADLTSQGFAGFLAFFATINLFIGIVNLAPLLPLDGGHVVIATYERLRSRRGHRYQVDVMKLLPLTYFVILLLGVLFVSTVFLDLVDPIRLN